MKERTMVRAIAAVCLVACLLGGCVGGGRTEERMGELGEVAHEKLATGEKFAVYVPPGEAPKGGWPCIVFLNGRGECGTDGKEQLTVGLMPAVERKPLEWPFVIVFPQKPDQKSKWIDHRQMVLACLAQAEGKWRVDKSRVYLTGLSQGGNGTWEIAAADTDRRFAAIAPVCGYGEAERIAGNVKVPVWAFHGERDDVVPSAATKQIVGAIERFGERHGLHGRAVYIEKDDGTASTLRITIYADLNHGSWDRAYRESGLAGWLLRFDTDSPLRVQ